jgi:hypothetical protein
MFHSGPLPLLIDSGGARRKVYVAEGVTLG